jgi:protein O-GlcNAc transferase
MNMKSFNRLLLSAAGILFAAVMVLPSESDTAGTMHDADISDELRVYREAMVWFKKAEAMIGTPEENSEKQADLFRKAIEINPDFMEAHYNLGLIYANLKKMREAAVAFETVLKLDHRFDNGIFFMLAAVYRELGDDMSAISTLQNGLRRHPGDMDYLRALVYLQLRNDRVEGAINSLEEILAREPDDDPSRIDLALLLQKRGDDKSAEKQYETVLSRDPDNFTARYNLALLHVRQNRFDAAVSELERARRIRPDHVALLERLGDMHTFLQQFTQAMAVYTEALSLVGSQGTTAGVLLGKMGFSLAVMNDLDEAVKKLEASVRIDPDNADNLFLLGDVYADLGRNDEAVAVYRQSAMINPERKEIHYNLGTLYLQLERHEHALAALREAVRLDPAFSAALHNLAGAAEKLGSDHEAIEARERLIVLGKAEAENYYSLGFLYAKTGRPGEAIASFAAAIEMEPETYRGMLREEVKNSRSILEEVRHKKEFMDLFEIP